MKKFQGVLFQAFHWYIAADENLWIWLAEHASDLAQAGYTAVWLPPVSKASGGIQDVGYAVYDLWDLGEFDQKNTVRTKYGTKDQLKNAIKALQKNNLQVYLDIVLNHKDGGDEIEEFEAWEVAEENRGEIKGDRVKVRAYTKFTFPGRQEKYSAFKWSWQNFAWVGHNVKEDGNVDSNVYKIKEIFWEDEVTSEKGNFDFLLGCDIDHGETAVKEELFRWGEWLIAELGIDGFRLDAVKHIRFTFFQEWLGHLRQHSNRELPAIGEYWSPDIGELSNYLDRTEGAISLFDVGLHHNFHAASNAGREYNLSTIFENTLVATAPLSAVTFVENHDSQPLCSLESSVQDWFKPLAYALILLREEGYPTVFMADYFGTSYKDNDQEVTLVSHKKLIDSFLSVRKNYAYGEQHDYFDHPQCIGWFRTGDAEHRYSCAIVMSSGDDGIKRIMTNRPGKSYRDATEHIDEVLTADKEGEVEFKCLAGKVSVWIEEP